VLEQYGEIGLTVAIDVAFDRCITVLHDVVQLALFLWNLVVPMKWKALSAPPFLASEDWRRWR
jgi:hypothetical protein